MKPGEKYIIEIDKVINVGPKTRELPFPDAESNQKYLATIKGFNSLVFDANGLEKLEKYEPEKESKDKSNTAAGYRMTRCRECMYWERDREKAHSGYCKMHKFAHLSKKWDIEVHMKTEDDFFCADGTQANDFFSYEGE